MIEKSESGGGQGGEVNEEEKGREREKIKKTMMLQQECVLCLMFEFRVQVCVLCLFLCMFVLRFFRLNEKRAEKKQF